MKRVQHPESALVRRSITLRQMDFPPEVSLTKSAQLRWLALALGVLSENESRTTLVSVLDALLFFLAGKKQSPTTAELADHLKREAKVRISEKLLRYHLNRFIEMGLIVRQNQRYALNQSPTGARNDLLDAFRHGVRQPTEQTLTHIENVLGRLNTHYARKK